MKSKDRRRRERTEEKETGFTGLFYVLKPVEAAS